MTFFDQNPIGRIINRISADFLKIDDYIPFSFREFLFKVALVISYPIGILVNFPLVAIPFVFSIVLMYYFFL